MEKGEAVNTAENEVAGAPKKKRKKNKLIIVAAAVVILAALGVGGWIWHEQPSFCNAICHTPMDPYLPTYESTPGQPAVDKWGNEVKNASAMLTPTHRAEQDITCIDCHVPTLGEQVTEAVHWVTGSYVVVDNETFGGVLEERSSAELGDARGISNDEFCLNDACHKITREDLKTETADRYPKINPHDAHHVKQDCTNCHKAHRASVMLCSECHTEAVVPDGWEAVAQTGKVA